MPNEIDGSICYLNILGFLVRLHIINHIIQLFNCEQFFKLHLIYIYNYVHSVRECAKWNTYSACSLTHMVYASTFSSFSQLAVCLLTCLITMFWLFFCWMNVPIGILHTPRVQQNVIIIIVEIFAGKMTTNTKQEDKCLEGCRMAIRSGWCGSV